MKKKIILSLMVATLVCGSYIIYNKSKPVAGEQSKLSNIIQSTKKYSSNEADLEIYEDIDINGDGEINSEDIIYAENLLSSISTDIPTSPIPTSSPSSSSTPTTSPAQTEAPTSQPKPSWIQNNTNRIIRDNSDIFEAGMYKGEYIFAQYDDITKTLANKYIDNLNFRSQEIVKSRCPALYTLNITGGKFNYLTIYGLKENRWIEVLKIDIKKIFSLSYYEITQVCPVLEYGAKTYKFYILQNDAIYLFDNDITACLDIPITYHSCFSLIENQMMLDYATTPIFVKLSDNNMVRFLIDNYECIIKLPNNKFILDIEKVTALKDKLVFSFSDGTHYVTDTILNSKSAMYKLEKELGELKKWDIKDITASLDKEDRLLIRLYDNTLYYYDIE